VGLSHNLQELKNLPEGGIYQEGYILRKEKGIVLSWEVSYDLMTEKIHCSYKWEVVFF
jgi:hypothetical protein